MTDVRRPSLGYVSRPGHRWSDRKLYRLVEEMRALTARCIDDLPHYQALSGERDALKRAIVATARDKDGTLVGFCSGVLLQADDGEQFLHMGLTCVDPTLRGTGLTRRLNAMLVRNYLLRRRPLGRVWLSCVACVKSSLGNVALHFDHVFPSPFTAPRPSPRHFAIARAIDREYRRWIHIRDDSTFDPDAFVFRGGARDTVFQKRRDDERYLHRHPKLNQFYDGLMDFERGDLVLQVASASAWTGLRHALGWSDRAVDLTTPHPLLVPSK